MTKAEFEKVYKNLFDIHQVHADENKMITKNQLMKIFNIGKIDVALIDMKESLAKKKNEKSTTPRGQEPAKKTEVYNDKQKKRQIEELKEWLKSKTKEQ